MDFRTWKLALKELFSPDREKSDRDLIDSWLAFDAMLSALLRCWFPLLVGVSCVFVFSQVPQGREAMIAAAEDPLNLLAVGFLISIISAAQLTVFSSLVLRPSQGSEQKFAAHFISGLVGLLPSLALAVLLDFQAPDRGGASSRALGEMRPTLSAMILLTTIVVVLVRNHDLKVSRSANPDPVAAKAQLGILFVYFMAFATFALVPNLTFAAVLTIPCLFVGDLLSWKAGATRSRGENMRAFGWLMCGVSFLMGAPLVFWPHSIAPLMQPVLTVYILLNFWVAIGLASLLLGQRLKTGLTNYVALICFAGLAFIFYRGPFNNGEIIPCPDKQPPAAGLREQVKSWLKAREKEFDDNAPYPVFFVAGEGGGIRAAAWTATNLAVLEDHSTSWSTTDEIAPSPEKRFSRHLFAISTVSGSSLGAAAFLALLNESGSNPEFYASRSRRAFERRTVNLLNRDFLSPTLASLLFSEILRGMSHWELAPDRGQVLQKSFEAAWDATFGVRPGVAGRFSQPFSQLWPTTNSALPALAFNGTAADSGSRIVYASFDFDFGTDSDAIGIRRLLADQDIPLSTAVLMSARFPLISPMGLFPEQSPAGGIEAVDGGFVDNSGAATLIEIIEIFRTTARELGYANKLRIYALSFSNSLGSSTALEDHRIFDPVLVFDRVRQQSAKRFLRLLDVAVQDSGGELLKINLRKDRIAGPELSLGWMLSNESWDGILAQVHCGLAEPSSNSFKVLELLRGSWKQKREAPAGAKLCWERRPPERE